MKLTSYLVSERAARHAYTLTAACCLAAVLLLFTGCTTDGGQPAPGIAGRLFAPTSVEAVVTPPSVATNYVVATNFVPVVHVDPASGMATTNTAAVVQPKLELVVLPAVTNWFTNYTTSPEAAAVVQGAGAVLNAVAPGVGTVASAVASGVLGLLAAWQTKRKKTAVDALRATVRGVEDARVAMRTTAEGRALDSKLVKALMDRQATHPDAYSLTRRILEQVTNRTTNNN